MAILIKDEKKEQEIWTRHYPKGVPVCIESELGQYKSIYDLVSGSLSSHAKRPAITCLDKTITYGELKSMIDQFTDFLSQEVGLKKGDRLLIMLPNLPQFVVAFMAAQRLGVICINTNPLYTPKEMQHQFADSGATAIVILNMFISKLAQIIEKTKIKTVISTSLADVGGIKGYLANTILYFKGETSLGNLEHKSSKLLYYSEAFRKNYRIQNIFKKPSEEDCRVHQNDLAVLQYTGGTTGVAKAAMLTHRNIIANAVQVRAWAKSLIDPPNEVVLTALPLYHIFALSVNFLTFLAMGCHVILIPKPIPIINTIRPLRRYKVTAMTGVNTLFNAMNNNKEFRNAPNSYLKVAIAGGMALQESVRKTWKEITHIDLTQGYGLTEASPVTHVNPLSGVYPSGSIGVPLPSTLAKIVDPDGKELPVGEIGELMVKGPQVMKGYWGREDETKKVLSTDGWLKTGDIAYRDGEGYFFIVDRKKDMIIISGFNVYPNEVEEVISQHPKVLENAVVGVEHPKLGEQVKAYVVPKDPSLTKEELIQFCKESLTNYKVPKLIEFRNELPKTNVGKVLRRQLRDEEGKSGSSS